MGVIKLADAAIMTAMSHALDKTASLEIEKVHPSLLQISRTSVREFAPIYINGLLSYICSQSFNQEDRRKFEFAVAAYIRVMLKQKVEAPGSKFESAGTDMADMYVVLSNAAKLDIYRGESCITHLFWALGETVVLALAVTVAARELVGLKAPLVVDSALDLLDMTLVLPFFDLICGLSYQVIVLLATHESLERLKAAPKYKFGLTPDGLETTLES